MSFKRFLQTIDKSFIGKVIDHKLNILKSIDPDRFYVENIRRFYSLPQPVAKMLCEMAVREGYFKKKYGVSCPNQDCGRIIMSVNSLDEIPDHVSCEICEVLERDNYQFENEEVDIIPYYQLNKDKSSKSKEVSYA